MTSPILGYILWLPFWEKRELIMQLTEKQVLAIKRKRGELDLTINALAEITGVSKWTLIDIFKHKHRNVNSITFKKLNDWLIDEYTSIR